MEDDDKRPLNGLAIQTSGKSGIKSKRSVSPSNYRKSCDLCKVPKDVLIRCRTDETLTWHFVCPGRCWRSVSGGEVDGPNYPLYTYGGMWKNRHAGVSAKKPKSKIKKESPREWSDDNVEYLNNIKVKYGNKVWVCRRSHYSDEKTMPDIAYRYWKEADVVLNND